MQRESHKVVMKNALFCITYTYRYMVNSVMRHLCSLCCKESHIKMLEVGMNKRVSVESGMFISTLEKALKKLYVERQAYLSGAFAGNHIHKCSR